MIYDNSTLYIIPARGGSKGIPRKNIKELGGKPLIAYSIEVAKELAANSHICLSTDDDEIAEVARSYGLDVPYKRPDHLATDTSGSREVIIDAMDNWQRRGIKFDKVVLLQPTSPFRTANDVRHCIDLYTHDLDMVVSVTKASCNPYYDCFETDSNGHLHISKGDGKLIRRQDAPDAWQYNGAIYVINPRSIRAMGFGDFSRRIPYPMPKERSIDLDSSLDWLIAESIIKHLQHNIS